MRPDERISVTLRQMIEGAQAIGTFLQESDSGDFYSDDMLRSAIERKIEILGEAVRRLPPDYLAAHPEVPWRGVLGQRNVLAHDYDDIRIDVIWTVASVDTPKLLVQLRGLLRLDEQA